MSDTLLGGRKISVRHRANNIETAVTVRQLPLSKIDEYGKRQTDIVKLAALLIGCDRPDGTDDMELLDALTLDSIKDIVKVGEELNDAFFLQKLSWEAERIQGVIAKLPKLHPVKESAESVLKNG